MAASTIIQTSVTTSAHGAVLSSNVRVLGSGSVFTNNVAKATFSKPVVSDQQDVLNTFLQSGLVSSPAQMADLKQMLAVLVSVCPSLT